MKVKGVFHMVAGRVGYREGMFLRAFFCLGACDRMTGDEAVDSGSGFFASCALLCVRGVYARSLFRIAQ